MIAPQTFANYPTFGSAATKCCPVQTKYDAGYIPGDVLPAEHLNWFLAGATGGITALNLGMNSVEQELQTLLCCSGIAPDSSCVNQVYNAVMYQINACTCVRAPKMHASTETSYGVGNASCYGHLKISDSYTSVIASCTGVAASQCALATVYGVAAGKPDLGNTAGCALGTANAGVAGTAARSDHVHPYPIALQNTINNVTYCAWMEAGNTLNITPANSNSWINWTGGSSETWIGDGTGCGTLGTLLAKTLLGTLCGNVCGNASSASSADYANYAGALYGGYYPENFFCACYGTDLGGNPASNIAYMTSVVGGWRFMLSQAWGNGAEDGWRANLSLPTHHSTNPHVLFRCADGNTPFAYRAFIELIDSSGNQTINGSLTASCFCGTATCASDSAKLGGYTYSQVIANAQTITTGTCGTCVSFWYNSTTHNGGISFAPNTPKNCWWDALQRALNCSFGYYILCTATSSNPTGIGGTGIIRTDGAYPVGGITIDSGGCVGVFNNSNTYNIQLHRNDGGVVAAVGGYINW